MWGGWDVKKERMESEWDEGQETLKTRRERKKKENRSEDWREKGGDQTVETEESWRSNEGWKQSKS